MSEMNINIVNLDRNLPDGLCTTAHWTATKQDGDYTASAYGSIGLPAKDPGSTRETSAEEFAEQINKAISQIEAGDFDVVDLEDAACA